MSKYAVIKIGSSQERVSIGDKLVVSNSFSETSLTPILVSPRKGQLVTEEKELKNFKVEIELLDQTKSKKLRIFQYKNKTGNRRRLGYREDNKIIEIKNIAGLEGKICAAMKIIGKEKMYELFMSTWPEDFKEEGEDE